MTYGEFIMYVKPTFCIKDSRGFIGNLKKFRTEQSITRLDLIRDWIFRLNQEYKLTMTLIKNDEKMAKKAFKK
jgi:hypothetical protein